MSSRRQARVIVLSGLYQMDVGNTPLDVILRLDWVERDFPADLKEFIRDLIRGTAEHLPEIDELIRKYSIHWSSDRISPVDKAILRFSIYSLLYRKDIPAKVAIDEAIEISKSFSTEKSYQFINGVLDGIKNKEAGKE